MTGRLRLRMALFFAALAGLSIVSVVAGGVVAVRQEAIPPVDLIGLGAVSVFGIVVSAALVALLFDENVARPIDALAAALRARAHGMVTAPLDPDSARHLADLSPAAAAVCERLADLDSAVAEHVATATASLEAQKEQLSAILSEIPLGVLAIDQNYRIVLYDRQCVHALGDVAELGLGRSVFRYLDEAALRKAVAPLTTQPDTLVNSNLPTADGQSAVNARIRLVGQAEGFVLAMDVDADVMAERPLVFDFKLIDRPTRGPDRSTPLAALPFVVFDTETTGLDPTRDELVQIGAVRILNGRLVAGETFETLVNPNRPIPATASRVHGITDDMVANAPSPPMAVAGFHRFARAETLVAHNAPFDLKFLMRHAQEDGYAFDTPCLDTVLLSAALYGEGVDHTLDAIAERLGVVIEQADRHTAMGDAIATGRVLLHMLPMLEAIGVTTLGDAITAMQRHQRLIPGAKDVVTGPAAQSQ